MSNVKPHLCPSPLPEYVKMNISSKLQHTSEQTSLSLLELEVSDSDEEWRFFLLCISSSATVTDNRMMRSKTTLNECGFIPCWTFCRPCHRPYSQNDGASCWISATEARMLSMTHFNDGAMIIPCWTSFGAFYDGRRLLDSIRNEVIISSNNETD